jgi:hypothetical protein
MGWFTHRTLSLGIGATQLAGSLLTAGAALAATKSTDFDLVVSKGAATCLPYASGEVHIRSVGPVEIMNVDINGVPPPKSEFDLFVLQVPTAPFGVSWYQADIPTNDDGHGHVRVIGKFSNETFAVAPGTASAPVTFTPTPSTTRATRSARRVAIRNSIRSRCTTSGCGSTPHSTLRTPAARMR